MCRMFGMAAAEPVSPHQLLCEAPRSLRTLARQHADGWGVALRDRDEWIVERSVNGAADCGRFVELARRETRLAIAHIRKKTVGGTALANTHPFRRDGFVLAHNGTVSEVGELVAQTAPEQLARIEGETDSERLFAFVLTQIDTTGDIERGVAKAVKLLRDVADVSFLLSCGSRLYAYRAGRSLFTLERASVMMIASEQLTDEPWTEVPERTLVAIDTERVLSIAA